MCSERSVWQCPLKKKSWSGNGTFFQETRAFRTCSLCATGVTPIFKRMCMTGPQPPRHSEFYV